MMMPESQAYPVRDDDDQGEGGNSNNNNRGIGSIGAAKNKQTFEMQSSGSGEGGDENNIHEQEVLFVKGENQVDDVYRDVWFARLFYVNVIGVLITAIVYGPYFLNSSSSASAAENNNSNSAAGSQNDDDDDGGDRRYLDSNSSWDNNNNDTSGSFNETAFVMTIIAVLVTALVSTTIALSIMMKYSTSIVKIAFAAAPTLLFVLALIFCVLLSKDGDSDGINAGMHLLLWAVIYAAVSACLYLYYKRFIPFAASTLHAAATAIEYHKLLYVVSVGGLLLNYAFLAAFIIAFLGVLAHADAQGQVPCSDLGYTTQDGYPYGSMCDKSPPNGLALFALLLALYWTLQTIKNVIHCTTAGTVGSWWFSGFGDHTSMCSRDVIDSLVRSLTYSFGSICFGSLIVAIMQTLEEMSRSARRNRRGALLACILECILHFLRRWLEYFNSWAFVYVGLYGYSYITAGKNVMTLFKQKGWSSFVSDRLVYRVLASINIAVGILCGSAAALTDMTFGPMFDDSTSDGASMSHVFAFFIGLFIGLIMSSIALFVVESAVRTVIVCFAESPAEFQEHHPTLCDEMRNGWGEAYPDVWGTGTTTDDEGGSGESNNNSHHSSGSQHQVARATVLTTQSDIHY